MDWKDKVTGKAKSAATKKATDTATSKVSKEYGNTAAGVTRDGIDATQNGNSQQFAQKQKLAAQQRAREVAERKYSEAKTSAASKVADKYGNTAGQAASDAVDAARHGNTQAFADQQKEAAKNRTKDAAERKVQEGINSARANAEEKVGGRAGQAASQGIAAAADNNLDAFAKEQATMSAEEKRELLKDMDISHTSRQVQTQDEMLSAKTNPLKDMDISYSSQQVQTQDEMLADMNKPEEPSAPAELSGNSAADALSPTANQTEEDSPPPPKKLSFAPNIVNKLVIGVGNRFTLQDAVDRLLATETEKGYEAARFEAMQLNYQALCELANTAEAKNDPNIMPSRFMLLPGADDSTLESNGCLDDIPWPVHADGPQKLSVAFLKQCLILNGCLEGDSAIWASSGTDSEPDATPNDEPATFDDALKAAFDDFLKTAQKQRVAKKITPQTYTVRKGDNLSAIADKYGYPSWNPVFEANKDKIPNPDIIQVGQVLSLPPLESEQLKPWMEDKEAPESIAAAKAYHFPAQYFSLSLTDDEQTLLEREKTWQFEAYTKEPAHRFYHFELTAADQTQVMLPTSPNVAIGFYDEQYQQEALEIVPYASVIASQENTQEASADTTDDENAFIYDDLPLASA